MPVVAPSNTPDSISTVSDSRRCVTCRDVPGYVPGKPLPDNVGTAALSATPSAINRSALREPLDVKRWLLWGTLVVASLLLGYMALRLSRQMRANDEQAKR